MNLRTFKTACLLSVMTLGGMPAALPAMSANSMVQNQVTEKEWTLLETKDGVSCYYKIDQIGTCNNGVHLRFVNNSKSDVTVNFSVDMIEEVSVSRKVTLKAGQTLDPSSEPALIVRPDTQNKPVISFTVIK
jgi:hypothetical protein